ncbi:hypothetical protein ACFJIX_05835 [Roseateles sp. UC29_93]|uniref:hypothetical protein n=1 Tax=Roseateles sp. UC29_93 TaxID=3350177 RepID=UPI00367348FC
MLRITGYKFADQHLSQLRDGLSRLQLTTGVTVSATLGSSAGFDAVVLRIEAQEFAFSADVAMVQSAPDQKGGVWFGPLSSEGEQLGPHSAYRDFREALVFAEVRVRQVIESLKAREERSPQHSSATAIESALLSQSEVLLVQEFANSLGLHARLPGFVRFTEFAAGATSMAVGLMHNDTPVLLASIVVSTRPEGGQLCTVRDFNNQPLPGPQSYESISAVLVSQRSYFLKVAEIASKHLRPTLLGRLKAALR